MLKTISVTQVRLGMYLHALGGAWVNHPFWKKSFTLNAAEDLQKLQTSAVKEVVIDTDKGLDVQTQETPVETTDLESEPAPIDLPSVKKVSAAEETEAAKRVIDASKTAVTQMFDDVRLGRAIQTEVALPLVDEISASIDRNRGALISLARLKTQDDYTYMHSVAVCALMTALAKELGLSDKETQQAGFAGLLHDLGKAAIPAEILNKPGALTDDEFAVVKQHPKKGYQLLMQAGITDPAVLDVCLHHHEKVDGSGYPEQLTGDDISIFAKMGAVCDVYDAVTSDRPYKHGWEPSVSLKRMATWEGHFDEAVFKAFVKSVGIYPIGSVVLLKSKRLAVVVDQSEKSLLAPVVKVFFSTRSKVRIPIEEIDLSKPAIQDEVIELETAETWGIQNVNQIWSEPA